MEFHTSCLVAEEFSEEVSRRIFDSLILSMKQGGTASKTCEKHGQLCHASTVPLIAEFSYLGIISSGNRDTDQLSPCST